MIPDGLEWGLPGTSVMAYVPLEGSSDVSDNLEVREAILQAHNRWCFAKDETFRRIEDIESVVSVDENHIRVKWNDTKHLEHTIKFKQPSELLREHKSVIGGQPPPEVWINGIMIAHLSKDTVAAVLKRVSQTKSCKVCFKQSEDGKVIRIDRFFRGGLYHLEEVFDHVMDNLIAMEDPVKLNEKTLIGTATLPDWIMGGLLSSRLFIQEQPNGDLLFLRPLYNDDIKTSDRRFMLKVGRDDDKIKIVAPELKRLMMLAALPAPAQAASEVPQGVAVSSDDSVESDVSRQHRRNRRKFFGL